MQSRYYENATEIVEILNDEFDTIASDSFGHGAISYWPNIPYKELDEDEESDESDESVKSDESDED